MAPFKNISLTKTKIYAIVTTKTPAFLFSTPIIAIAILETLSNVKILYELQIRYCNVNNKILKKYTVKSQFVAALL